MIGWQEAWQEALYGDSGFYRQPAGPAGHFTTSTHPPLGDVFAQGIVALAAREGLGRVIDIGCGRGELLRAVHAIAPELDLLGVDVVERPAALPEAIAWVSSPGGAGLPAELVDLEGALVVANEWLDVVPCTVAEIDDDGVAREVHVDPVTGEERLGPPLTEQDRAWCSAHWPTDDLAPGDRLEVGASRDAAFTDLASRLRSGLLVAVDYGHLAGRRPTDGTLIGYANGMVIGPEPDGFTDLTAHVAMDSLPGAQVRTQREWLLELLPCFEAAGCGMAQADPAGYLASIARRSVLAQLTDPRGLGGFYWATLRRPTTEGDPAHAR